SGHAFAGFYFTKCRVLFQVDQRVRARRYPLAGRWIEFASQFKEVAHVRVCYTAMVREPKVVFTLAHRKERREFACFLNILRIMVVVRYSISNALFNVYDGCGRCAPVENNVIGTDLSDTFVPTK